MRRFASKVLFRSVPLLGALVLTGCNRNEESYSPTHGQVFIGNRPAHGAVVTLVQSEESTTGPRPSGKVNEDGTFTLTTFEPANRRTFTGVRPGTYVVLITWSPELTREGLAQPNPLTDLLGGRYNDPKTSPLRAEVSRGSTELPAIYLQTTERIAWAP